MWKPLNKYQREHNSDSKQGRIERETRYSEHK